MQQPSAKAPGIELDEINLRAVNEMAQIVDAINLLRSNVQHCLPLRYATRWSERNITKFDSVAQTA
jgi:hypothetical protein